MTHSKQMNLPEAYLEQMKQLLMPSDYEAYIQSFDACKYNGLRINTQKISVDDFLKISPFELEPIPWTRDGFYFSGEKQPTKHPYYFAGLYYIQEPSAMAPVALFDISEGDLCLDLCAAPGGKTLQMSARAGLTGFVVSNDISGSRLMAVVRNIEIFGLKNVVVLCETVERLKGRFNGAFDVVLVDAPCSGEGMFRKEPSLIKHWNAESNTAFATKQWDIVRHVPDLLADGGCLGYSTCTFSPKENEEIIERLLDQNADLELAEIPNRELFSEAYSSFSRLSKGIARLYPHLLKGEGHFAAKLIKSGKRKEKFLKPKYSEPPEAFRAFQERYLTCHLEGRFYEVQDKLYLEPNQTFDFSGLRVLRSGWYLGQVVRGKFEPSQAFAMGLKSDEFKQVVYMKSQDRDLIRYLKCETLDLKGEEGYHLICVDGYPLGFCRLNKGVFKNMYPVSWRLIKEF